MTDLPVPSRGLLDTSVVIDHDVVPPALLPDESAISAVTRNPLPFDAEAARMYGLVFAAIKSAGGRPHPADLRIAATAAANGLPLYTRNPSDFAGLEGVVTVMAV